MSSNEPKQDKVIDSSKNLLEKFTGIGLIKDLGGFLSENPEKRLGNLKALIADPRALILGTILTWIITQIKAITDTISGIIFTIGNTLLGDLEVIIFGGGRVIADGLVFAFKTPVDILVSLIEVYNSTVNSLTSNLGILAFPINLTLKTMFVVVFTIILARIVFVVLEIVGSLIQIDIMDIVDRILGR